MGVFARVLALVLIPAESIPDFTPETILVTLTVTPAGGGTPASVHARFLYRNSDVTVSCSTTLETKHPNVTPVASETAISVSGSLTITQLSQQNASCGGVPLAGTVTYMAGGQLLGTSNDPTASFVVQGSDLGVGDHTITVTYAIWNGVAFPPYSADIRVTVTP
jgi:hypothetical protein